jgi:Tfp pilus assembly protein PilX
MSGNARDMAIAFQAAEMALRDGRRDINGITVPAPHNTTVGYAGKRNPSISGKTGFGDGTDANNESCGDGTAPGSQNYGLCRTWTYNTPAGTPPRFNNNGTSYFVIYGKYTGALEVKGVALQPRYFVEVLCLPQHGGSLGDPTFCNFYRISARGYGNNINTQVTVQEIFLRP